MKINAILKVIENPHIQKSYRDLRKCFEEMGMKQESQAIEYLIEKKFRHVNDTNNNKEQ
jgi:hypothetical protein